jgi:hypothetical protein
MTHPFTKSDAMKFLADIQEAVKDGDNEVAHALEDEMREAFIAAVANDTCAEIRDCAELVLKSSGWDFQRWYA